MKSQHVGAPEDVKLRRGPALTRNLKNLRFAHVRVIIEVARKAVSGYSSSIISNTVAEAFCFPPRPPPSRLPTI